MKLGVLLGLLLTFWLLEVVIASTAPLSCQTTGVFGEASMEMIIYILGAKHIILIGGAGVLGLSIIKSLELGFISNPVEEKYLGPPEFQKLAA